MEVINNNETPMNDEDFKKMVLEHLAGSPEQERELREMRDVIFGNPRTGTKGVSQKVDEIHEIIVQAKGWKSLGIIIVLIGASFAVLKEWLMK